MAQLAIPVLLDTKQVMVISKPAGVPFHSTAGQEGILSLLRNQHSERMYAVHRLDAVTSGAMMLAKDPAAAKELMAAFRARAVAKYYVAISAKKPSKKEGSVKGDMRRGRRGGWMLERSQLNPAITRFTSAGVPGGAPGRRALLLKPESGKTHQLRVALKSLGSPVLGDERYANKAEAVQEERAYLHCCALRVALGGRAVQVVCAPTEGAEFLTEGFAGVFNGWFPEEMRSDEGTWFPESKLLQSRLALAGRYGGLTESSIF